jgi:hypothetical protein
VYLPDIFRLFIRGTVKELETRLIPFPGAHSLGFSPSGPKHPDQPAQGRPNVRISPYPTEADLFGFCGMRQIIITKKKEHQ